MDKLHYKWILESITIENHALRQKDLYGTMIYYFYQLKKKSFLKYSKNLNKPYLLQYDIVTHFQSLEFTGI